MIYSRLILFPLTSLLRVNLATKNYPKLSLALVDCGPKQTIHEVDKYNILVILCNISNDWQIALEFLKVVLSVIMSEHYIV